MKNLLKRAFPFALLLLTTSLASAQDKTIASATPETEKQKPVVAELTLPEGTMVEVQLSNEIHSNQVQAGHLIAFTVVEPIKINGLTVIEKGAHARGRIAKVHKAGRWGKAGEIQLEIQDAVAVDGTRIPLKFTHREKAVGDSDHATTAIRAGASVAAVAVLGPFGIPYAAFFLVRSGLNKGSNAVIPAGLLFETKVIGNAKVKTALVEPTKKPNEVASEEEKVTTEKTPL